MNTDELEQLWLLDAGDDGDCDFKLSIMDGKFCHQKSAWRLVLSCDCIHLNCQQHYETWHDWTYWDCEAHGPHQMRVRWERI